MRCLGRNYVTKADLPIVIRVVLSTGPVQRVKILDKLLSDGKEWDTSQITNSLEVSRPTARKTMIELTILGLVDMYPKIGTEDNIEHTNEEKKIWLKDKFKSWLNTEEFKELRKGEGLD
jgi:Mn-dependent DtxR family transcriptional regulator